jgi:hypothetical protein
MLHHTTQPNPTTHSSHPTPTETNPPPSRLDSVIRSDLVIVMDAGTVAEIGPPSELLDNRASAFSSLVDRTGAAGAAALRKMADDFFAERAQGIQMGRRARPSLDAVRRSSIDEMARRH